MNEPVDHAMEVFLRSPGLTPGLPRKRVTREFPRIEGQLATFHVFVNGLRVDTVYRDSARYSPDGIKHLLVSKGGFPSTTEVVRVA